MSKKRWDKYVNYRKLASAERYGVDYRIRALLRDSPVAVIAPHGGKIEPGTSKLARAIAAADYSFYSFEGLRRRPHGDLHITSTRFDEPRGLRIVRGAQLVVAVHGLKGRDQYVAVGGRHDSLRELISEYLGHAGFDARTIESGPHAGREPGNICNKGILGAGVQLEITRALRNELMKVPDALLKFAAAVRKGTMNI